MSPEADTLSQQAVAQQAVVVTDSITYRQRTFGRPDAFLYPSVRIMSEKLGASIKPEIAGQESKDV
jgi:hypothetical protein